MSVKSSVLYLKSMRKENVVESPFFEVCISVHEDNNCLRDRLYFKMVYELKTGLLTWFFRLCCAGDQRRCSQLSSRDVTNASITNSTLITIVYHPRSHKDGTDKRKKIGEKTSLLSKCKICFESNYVQYYTEFNPCQISW